MGRKKTPEVQQENVFGVFKKALLKGIFVLARIGDGVLIIASLSILPFKLLERNVDRITYPISQFLAAQNYRNGIARYQKMIKEQSKQSQKLYKKSIRKIDPAKIIQPFIKSARNVFGTAKQTFLIVIQDARVLVSRISLPTLPHFPVQKKMRKQKLRLEKVHLPYAASFISPQWKGFLAGTILSLFIIFVPYNTYLFLKNLPNPHLLTQRQIPVTTQITDRDGKLLYEIYGDQNRKPVELSNIPEIIQKATIAIEDRDFYTHQGISLRGIFRALTNNVQNKSIQGGSTITQQLIKNTLLSPEVSYSRKVKEAFLALWAEALYSKSQILEMYLNQVPYGGTAWGVEAASETYYGKKVSELNLAESALLAGLPAAPTRYSPHGAHPELAKERQIEVLQRMVEEGYITKEEKETAENTPVTFKPPTTNIKAPHFVMYVKQLLVEKYGERLVEQGGLRVTTSLDVEVQEKVEDIVFRNLEDLRRLRVGNGAALVTKPSTGEILAMVGSKDYFNLAEDGNVNLTTALRQPGSSIKLVNYVAALENGFTPANIIDDSPVAYPLPGQAPYAPVNYDGKFHGRVPFRTALGSSFNIPAVKILNQIGVGTMIEMGKRMGITSWNDESRFGLSLTLGGGEVPMIDLAKAYGVVANQGIRVDINPILSVKNYQGKTYEEHKARSVRVISEDIAYIISDILADNNARAIAFGTNSQLVIPGKKVSVKTGTTDNKRDNWTIGYTPSYVVATWVGNNDNTPMDPFLTSGVTGAAPIWNQIISELLKDKANEEYQLPKNTVQLPCFGRVEYFVRGTEPRGGCAPLPTPVPSPTPNP